MERLNSRDALRNQIGNDMRIYAQLRQAGCPELANLFRTRADGLKPALRSFTRESQEAANALAGFENGMAAFNAMAPYIARIQADNLRERAQQRPSGDGNYDDGTCVRQCRDGSTVQGVTTANGQCFFEATCAGG